MNRWALVFAIVVGANVLGYALFGCANVLKEIESVSDPKDDAKMSDCRAAGRAEKQVGNSDEQAWSAYDACMRDAGFRR